MKKYLTISLLGLAATAGAQTAPSARSKPEARAQPGVTQLPTHGRTANGKVYQLRQRTGAAAAPAYRTQPHAMRVTIPDTTGQKMRRLKTPTITPHKGVVPLPPERRVEE